MKPEAVVDGNALAGALAEVFAFEPTESVATCAGCGNRGPMGTWVVFVSAPGTVARCPGCDQVQIRVVRDGRGRSWIDLSGVARVEIGGNRRP
jgi:hypothetical protein